MAKIDLVLVFICAHHLHCVSLVGVPWDLESNSLHSMSKHVPIGPQSWESFDAAAQHWTLSQIILSIQFHVIKPFELEISNVKFPPKLNFRLQKLS